MEMPVSGQALHLQAKLAEDFAEMVEKLGWSEVLSAAGLLQSAP